MLRDGRNTLATAYGLGAGHLWKDLFLISEVVGDYCAQARNNSEATTQFESSYFSRAT